MKLLRYNNFIKPVYENLDFLLEAKMVFTQKFKDLLDAIDNPLSKKILELEDKDVDVDVNYIDVSDPSFIDFKSDKKVSAKTAIVELDIDYREGMDSVDKKEKSSTWTSSINRTLLNIQFHEFYYNINNKLVKYQKLSKEEFDDIISDNKKATLFYKDGAGKDVIETFYLNGGSIYTIETMDGKEKYYIHSFDQYPILIKDERKLKSQKLRVGSFAQTLLKASGEEVNNRDLEDFVTKFGLKAREAEESLYNNFKIVEGDDIRKFYYEGNYYKSNAVGHTLGNSCMRYARCQSYLDIYVKNPKQVQMVVLLLEEDPSKIKGRALLWKSAKYECTLDEGVKVDSDTPFMDRIYVNNHKDEELFKQYAIKNGWVYKAHQDTSGEDFMFNKSETSIEKIEVYLSVGGFTKFPYMDTLCNYHPDYKVLTNLSDDLGYDSKYWVLQETDGTTDQGCMRCDGEDEIECRACRGEGNIECESCEGNETIVCDNCEGDGTIDDEECTHCHGDGSHECSDCDGEGSQECNTCDGRGAVDCPECQ